MDSSKESKLIEARERERQETVTKTFFFFLFYFLVSVDLEWFEICVRIFFFLRMRNVFEKNLDFVVFRRS